MLTVAGDVSQAFALHALDVGTAVPLVRCVASVFGAHGGFSSAVGGPIVGFALALSVRGWSSAVGAALPVAAAVVLALRIGGAVLAPTVSAGSLTGFTRLFAVVIAVSVAVAALATVAVSVSAAIIVARL